MRDELEKWLRAVDVPNPERAELLWAQYRAASPGADEAFATLLAWYGNSFYRRIWGFVRSSAAEDVFQDVLAKLHQYRRSPHLNRFADAIPWLRTVADNACRDYLRRSARRTRREEKRAVPAWEDSRLGERTELQEMLTVALEKLSSQHREAVALVFFEGMDKQAAAALLNVNRDTLAKRLGEALERLRVLVPAPVVLVAGGMLGVQSALSAGPRALSPTRLGDLAGHAVAKAAAAGSPLGKVVAATMVGLTLGGVALAGWAAWPQPEPISQVVERPRADPNPETLQAKNLRILRADVVPRVVEALQTLAPDGKIERSNFRANDTRVFFDVDLVFQDPPPGVGRPRFRFEYDTHARWSRLFFDDKGSGTFRRIDPTKAIIRVRELNYELTLKSEPLTRAVAALDGMPTDLRADDEATAYRSQLVAALQLYLGTWHRDGDPARWVRIEFHEDRGLSASVHYSQPGVPAHGPYLHELTLLPDGRMLMPAPGDQFLRLSADGTRLELTPSGETWRRPP